MASFQRVIENSKKKQEIKKYHYGLILSHTRVEKDEKERR